jgi:D-alanyl-D-alanine carboxypeptidase
LGLGAKRVGGMLAAVCASALMMNAALAVEIDSSAEYAFITDFQSGKVLMDKNADETMKPASMAKIMTVFIVFQRIKDKSLSLDDTFLVSEKAWRKGGSKTFIEVGKQVSVRDLLNGVIVQSGNDAAIALAEGISGTENGFADEMNYTAQKLGMKNTVFRNATGWPDPEQFTTARDLNILATALIRDFPVDEFPELYPMFAKTSFAYNGIDQPNRNPLVYGTAGADGLKTGLSAYRCGNEPSPENGWAGENINRYCDPAYDKLLDELKMTADLEKRGEIGRKLNDMLTKDSYTIVPLTWRGRVSARSNSLGGVVLNTWDTELWNVEDWYRID